MKNNILFLIKVKILVISFNLIFNSCIAISIDSKDVVAFKKAWDELSLLLFLKVDLCKKQGSKFRSLGIPYMLTCTNPDPDIYLWQKSVDYCRDVIMFANCPSAEVWDDLYLRAVLSQCDFTKIKMYNNKKPLQGNLFDFRIHNGYMSEGPDTSCI